MKESRYSIDDYLGKRIKQGYKKWSLMIMYFSNTFAKKKVRRICEAQYDRGDARYTTKESLETCKGIIKKEKDRGSQLLVSPHKRCHNTKYITEKEKSKETKGYKFVPQRMAG